MGRFLTQGISLLLVPFYTRVFTPDDYGAVDLLNIFATIVALVVPLQVTQAVGRFYSDTDSTRQATAVASSALVFTFATLGLFLIVVLVFPAAISSQIFGDASNSVLVRVVGAALFFNGMFYFAQNQLNWMQRPKEHAASSIVTSLVTIGVTIICVLILDVGIVGVFIGQACGGALGAALGFYLSRASYRIVFDRILLSQMLRFSLPLVPAAVFVYGLAVISRLLITQFMTLADLGLFAIGFRISTVATLIMGGIMTSITPIIYSKYRNQDTPVSVEKAFRMTLLVAFMATVSISVFVQEILTVLTTPVYYSAGETVPYLLAASFLAGFHVFAPGLRIQKQTRLVAWLDFSAGVVSIILNVILIQYFGIVGASIASALASLFAFSIITSFAQQRYYIPYTWVRYLCAAVIAGLAIWARSWVVADNVFAVIGLKLLLVIAAMSVFLVILTSDAERRLYGNRVRDLVGDWRRGIRSSDDGKPPRS